MEVAQMLSERGMDLIEISGGTYEAPEMTGGRSQRKSSQEREAYFLEYCEEVRSRVKSPLMLTGGFRSTEGMEQALKNGACDVIGLARSLAINPDFPLQLLRGENIKSPVRPLSTGSKALDRLVPLEITWYTQQLHRMGRGLDPDPTLGALKSILTTFLTMGIQNFKRTRAR
jgi:2,4-dienoyl-CoA reductase-like NADH-dependent reductase (Old Yellow Enzyme family)